MARFWNRRLGVFIALGGALAIAGCATVAAEPLADFAISDVNVVDVRSGEVLYGQTILITDGRIVSIRRDRANRAVGSVTVDGDGAYAVPGLWDAHVHILQNDGANELRRMGPAFLSYGVTHVRDMGSSPAARADARDLPEDAPHVIGAGPAFWAFELPYGDKAQQRIVRNAAETEAAVAEAAASGADFIKVYAGFEPERLRELATVARRHGLRIAGHAQPGAPIDEQARLGLSTVEHVEFGTFLGCGPDPEAYFNRTIASRYQNSGESVPAIYTAFAAAVDREACVAMWRRAAEAGLAMTPTLIATALPPERARRLLAEAPEGLQADLCNTYLQPYAAPDAEAEQAYVQAGRFLFSMVHEAGVPLLAGTDTPIFCSAPASSYAVELSLLSEFGLSNLEVLQAATLTPARVFGFGDRLGVLEAGKEADLVLLSANPLETVAAYARPVGVYTRGRWRDEAELTRMRRVPPASAPSAP